MHHGSTGPRARTPVLFRRPISPGGGALSRELKTKMLSALTVRFLFSPTLGGWHHLTLNTIPEDCDRNGFRSNEHNVCADALSQKQLYLTRSSLRRFWRLQSFSRPYFFSKIHCINMPLDFESHSLRIDLVVFPSLRPVAVRLCRDGLATAQWLRKRPCHRPWS